MTAEPPRNSGLRPSRRAVLAGAAGLSLAATAGHAAAPLARTPPTAHSGPKQRLGMVLFDGFQVLDVFGPLAMFGALADRLEIVALSERGGLVKSSAGPAVMADSTLADAPPLDILVVPGGMGTRREVGNAPFLKSIQGLAEAAQQVATVCTGAALLAKTGLLDGRRATTNKLAWPWATAQGRAVQWVARARWVEDGKFISSSGVSAGTDMALALIRRLYGAETAQWEADQAEYRWHDDPSDDPFAALNGLVP